MIMSNATAIDGCDVARDHGTRRRAVDNGGVAGADLTTVSLVVRPRHPVKALEAVIRAADTKGWRVERRTYS